MAKPNAVADKIASRPLIMAADGSLKTPRAEEFALLLADDLTPAEAWRALHPGSENPNGSSQGKTRQRYMADPVFQLRLENLLTEKAETEADPVFGDARWMCKQLWRRACLANDIVQMGKATDLMFRMQDKMAPAVPAGGPVRGPGAPVSESQQTRRNAASLRADLLTRGVPAPAEEAE